jgi:hypothetical protein
MKRLHFFWPWVLSLASCTYPSQSVLYEREAEARYDAAAAARQHATGHAWMHATLCMESAYHLKTIAHALYPSASGMVRSPDGGTSTADAEKDMLRDCAEFPPHPATDGGHD